MGDWNTPGTASHAYVPTFVCEVGSCVAGAKLTGFTAVEGGEKHTVATADGDVVG